jgi:hypothetical protein
MDHEIIHAVRAKGGKARLLGGRAVALLCAQAIPDELKRESLDIDLFILRRDRKIVTQTLKEVGCAPETEFNLLNGNERLMFHHGDTKIDIFVDTFRMSHTLHLANRMADDQVCLPPADLLLTKLQVAEINVKDLTDIAALLLALPFDGRSGIDADYLAKCLAKDWGLWRTSTLNLIKLRQTATDLLPSAGGWRERLFSALDTVESEIDKAPKSIAWRARSIVGERLPWFERPEEPEVRETPTSVSSAASG